MSDLMLCLKCNGYSVYKNKCTCKDKQIKQLQKDNKRMFLEGFKLSGEGWNGEYPFNSDDNEIWDAIEDSYKELIDKHNSTGEDDE